MEQNTSVEAEKGGQALFTRAADLIAGLFGDEDRIYADRRRFARPGPKSAGQALRPGGPGRAGRIAVLPAQLDALNPPVVFDGDPVWWPPARDDHSFGSRPLVFRADGQPIDDTGDTGQWVRQVAEARRSMRVAKTILFHRGARARVSTVFLGTDVGAGYGNLPPVLWETMIMLGGPAWIPAGRWQYMSRNAAVHGHGLIVGALRTGWGHRRRGAR